MALVCKAFGDIITFTRASTATFTGSNGLIQSATTNTPRFDYDPVTLAAKGLLIEEQRTNLLTYSEDFRNTAQAGSSRPWIETNVTVTTGAGTAPDGTSNANLLSVASTATTTNYQDAVLSATSCSFSVYIKPPAVIVDPTVFFRIRNNTTAINLITGIVTLADMTVSGSGTAISSVGNGWYRLTLTATTGITSGDTIRIYSGFVSTSVTSGTSFYTWGAQLEAGAFATSYIPTVASQVTRSADAASVNTLSPWYNATEGTIYAEVDRNQAAESTKYPYSYSLYSTSVNRIDGYQNRTFNERVDVISASVNVATFTGTIVGANAVLKTATAYQLNNMAASFNSSTPTTDTSAAVPSAASVLYIGTYSTTGFELNGHLRRITYYPRRLSNAELQAITA